MWLDQVLMQVFKERSYPLSFVFQLIHHMPSLQTRTLQGSIPRNRFPGAIRSF